MTIRPRLRVALLAAVLAVSAVLVTGAFQPAPHTGGDNAAYVSLAHGLVTGQGYVDVYDPQRAPHTKYPPLFPLLLALAVASGATTWTALKAWVAAITVLSVGLTYLWTDRRTGSWAAFGVTLVMAASAGVVYYSHWVLSDPLFVFLTLLALWALERGEARDWHRGWLAFGLLAAVGAYLTRSAGLPLLAAIAGWLLLRRRYRGAALAATCFAIPVALWSLRGSGEGVGDYGTEFWLADPYRPAAGTVGMSGLVVRALANGRAYATEHLPAALVGEQGVWFILVGVAFLAAAAWGWWTRARRTPAAAELFVPVYAGLILVWPEVWGGDRFVLPVLPLLIAYGYEGVRAWFPAREAVGRFVAVAGMLVLLVPALGSWTEATREARSCAAAVGRVGAYGCYGPRVGAFVEAAAWSSVSLPPGSAVLTRKPRIFYVVSGLPSRTFPFDPDPEAHLALADGVGARYLLLDQWDSQAIRYVGSAVQARPGAFCFVRGFGDVSGGAQLLGIRPPGAREGGGAVNREGVRLEPCPADYLAPGVATDGARYRPEPSSVIPLLASGSRRGEAP